MRIDHREQIKYEKALEVTNNLNEDNETDALILYYIEYLKEQIKDLREELKEHKNFFKDFCYLARINKNERLG